jgi:hypothetical protein
MAGKGLTQREMRMFLSFALPCSGDRGVANRVAEFQRALSAGRVCWEHLQLFPDALNGVKKALEENKQHPVITHFFGAHNADRLALARVMKKEAEHCLAYPCTILIKGGEFRALTPEGREIAVTPGKYKELLRDGRKVFVHRGLVVWLPNDSEYSAALKAYVQSIKKVKRISSKRK